MSGNSRKFHIMFLLIKADAAQPQKKLCEEKILCCHFKSTPIHWWLGKRLALGHFHIGWLDLTASPKIAASRYCESRCNQK